MRSILVALTLALSPLSVAGDGDGLQIEDTHVGSGEEVVPGSKVSVHYTGRLADGTVFDSSLMRPEPFHFKQGADKVITGWDQGVLGMRVGGVRTLVVPPDMAYGARGAGPIPPNATLTFELRLVAMEPPRQPPAPPDLPASAFVADGSGPKVARLAMGTGAEAHAGDVVTMELTVWDAAGEVVDSTYRRDGAEPFVPGAGRHHPDLEAALLGARGGDALAIQLRVGADTPPWLALAELASVTEARRPPQRPHAVAEDAYVTATNGLQHHDIVVGTGDMAGFGQTVTVEYTGWLEDGTRFDSSLSRPGPFSFRLGAGQVIAGWDEGVTGMRVGGTRQLVIPAALGYGARGQPPMIPPRATLVFDVTLVAVQ